MKAVFLGLLLCLIAFPLKGQTKSKEAELEKFKEKLRIYLKKNMETMNNGDKDPMVYNPDTGRYKMPDGNITSYMQDPETGLMKEYKTGQIFDPESEFIYDPESGKIFDAEEKKYYEFDRIKTI